VIADGRSDERVISKIDQGTFSSGDGAAFGSALGVIIHRTGTESVSGAGLVFDRICRALFNGRAGLMCRRWRLATGMVVSQDDYRLQYAECISSAAVRRNRNHSDDGSVLHVAYIT
jgi:hypothetical protein